MRSRAAAAETNTRVHTVTAERASLRDCHPHAVCFCCGRRLLEKEEGETDGEQAILAPEKRDRSGGHARRTRSLAHNGVNKIDENKIRN